MRNEYLVAENRILKAQLKTPLRLTDAERMTLAEIAYRLGRKALEDVANVVKPDTLLGTVNFTLNRSDCRYERCQALISWVPISSDNHQSRCLALPSFLLKQRRRPTLDNADRAFWVALRAAWPRWTKALVIVKTDTVAKWHRERFRRHWAMISRQRHHGRPRIDATIRDLIREMATDGWGAPRIHGELMKLGFEVSEATVSRYMPRRPADPDQLKRWMVFLRNHKDVIAAMDLFTVPTASLRVLYGFFVIDHSRRRILHFNATFNPTTAWVIQQLREAFPFDAAPKYLILDRDAIFSTEVVRFIKAMGIKPCRTAYRSPWQKESRNDGSAAADGRCSIT